MCVYCECVCALCECVCIQDCAWPFVTVCVHACVCVWLIMTVCVSERERDIRIWYHTCATLAVSAHGRYTPPVLMIITLLIGLQLDLGGLSQPALQ